MSVPKFHEAFEQIPNTLPQFGAVSGRELQCLVVQQPGSQRVDRQRRSDPSQCLSVGF